MFTRSLLLALLALTLAFRAEAKIFDPETFHLANGMQVVVVSNHRAPVVTHMVWYKVGAADEPPGKSGIAHFLEHLMFKGTEAFGPGVFSQTVARNGGRENAFTGHDYTGYYQTIAKDRLETVMRMEADRMRGLVLEADIIEPERQVVLEERRQRVDNEPSAVLREHVSAALYLNHPYRIPIIGWDHEVAALSVEDILAFYRRWYAPANAILVVAGDITAEELRPLAETYYGTLPQVDVATRARPTEPPQKAARTVEFRHERVGQPSWSRIFPAPSHQSGDSRSAYALEVLSEALGGTATSRLYRSLVIDKRLAVSAGVHYDGDRMGPAEFTVYASPRPGVSLEDLEAAVEAELAAVLAEGIDEAAIERARAGLLADAVYARDSLSAGARMLGAALARGLDVEHVETWPERIEAVTKAEVDAAARIVIHPGRAVTARLLPAGKEG